MSQLKIYKFLNLNTGGAVPETNPTVVPQGVQPSVNIDDIYKGVELLNISEIFSEKTNVNSTYGEMKSEGIRKMIEVAKIGAGDKFIDLGSGNGRAAMEIFLYSGANTVFGVEFYYERWLNSMNAQKILYRMQPELLNSPRLLTYQLQNIKDVYFLNMFTVIYMCSTCYPDELLQTVYDKVKDSKEIRCIITHKKFDPFLAFLPILTTANLPCTWSEHLTWHFYFKSR